MYRLIRPLLFSLDPERAHHFTLQLLSLPFSHFIAPLFRLDDPKLTVEAFGLKFRNRVGLAAGYDKNGIALRGLAALGFGHIEVGTLTRKAQDGNPRPRVFRLPNDEALINRMGFPNDGVSPFIKNNLRQPADTNFVLGVNIGKSKDTPLENAAEEYCALLTQVSPSADYVAVNISSPNTPQLRQLQTKKFVVELLSAISQQRSTQSRRVPLLVKIAPDLAWQEIDDVLEAIQVSGFDGIIATNTTLSREGLKSDRKNESGGLSGAPLRVRSTEIVRYIAQHTNGKLPIIAVGGINSAASAVEKLEAGATLIQIYTGLIYEGPRLVKRINQTLKLKERL